MERSMGLAGATGVGVGAIVGGGILALAGVAFAATGPSAVLAFALNGVIALVTALSFAELASSFPESGGTYTFSKKVLSVRAAFMVGWVVWFASLVAAVLYALGFGYFAVAVIGPVWERIADAPPPDWFGGRWSVAALAVLATLFYTAGLWRRSGGGGNWANGGKVLVFGILIAAGLWALMRDEPTHQLAKLSPFFTGGAVGLFEAMGFTFIALQGFDLIAAVGGEIKNPSRTIPRAMVLSLAIALAIYLPLLVVVATVGMATGETVGQVAEQNPETIIALAARRFLGSFGYWLVIVAALLSMASALQANLLAASRVALTMARDRTLPHQLELLHARRGTPGRAILATAGIVIVISVLIPNVAAAGAASSLIFLVTFALAHWIAVLARRRAVSRSEGFQTPLFPALPIGGLVACLALAAYQGVMVPSAGWIASAWLAAGIGLYLFLFEHRARVRDASSEALDPRLARLRGRSPLVLAPIANPAHAEVMVEVATALAPPNFGRVLLLSVVVAPEGWKHGERPQSLTDAQEVLAEALSATHAAGAAPEALTTVAPSPWPEIVRVSKAHSCESLLVGLSRLDDESQHEAPLDELLATATCDVVVLRAPDAWRLADVRRVLVPLGGGGGHDELRARLLGSLRRTGVRDVVYLRAVPANASPRQQQRVRRELARIADDEAPGCSEAVVIASDDVAQAIVERAAATDLVILGLHRVGRHGHVLGSLTATIARSTDAAMLCISHYV